MGKFTNIGIFANKTMEICDAMGVQIEFAKVFSIYFNFQIFHFFASTMMVVTTYLVHHIY